MKNSRSVIAVFIVSILFIGMGVIANMSHEENTTRDYSSRVIYQQESVDSIDDRAYSDPSAIPYHKTVMVTFGLGDATSQEITWDVGDFTGLHVPDPKQNYQKGINNSWYGSTAVQMYQNYAGVQVHTYSAESHPSSNLANAQLAYWWYDSDDVRVWTSGDSIMKMSAYLQVPRVWVEGGAVAYSNIILLFKDTTTGKSVWFIVNYFDTREESIFKEWIGFDSGTNIPMIVTYFGHNTKYAYLEPNSYPAINQTWTGWHYYEFRVNRFNFTTAINDVNNQYSWGMSNNPEDYIISELTVQAEIYWPEGSNGHLGVSMHNVELEELNSAIPEFPWM